MTLRQKFFMILAMLAVILGANVALSIWSIRFLERELAWPLRSAQPVLSGLHGIKRLGEQQANELGIGRFTIDELVEEDLVAPNASEIAPRLLAIEQQIVQQLDEMEQVETLRLRSGVSTTQNLRTRSQEIRTIAEQWGDPSGRDAYEQLIERIEARHELIERIEGRIIEDAALANTYGERLRVLIFTIIAVGLVGTGLVAAYSVILLRRWVLEPVERLREGAQHFARG